MRPEMFLLMSLSLFFAGMNQRLAQAGLTAADVVVVVNGNSVDSRTIANHYVAMRAIPANNIVVLNDVPQENEISVDDFRDRILRPLLAEIDRRKLQTHIQCIAYSADFPTCIDISSDYKDIPDMHKVFTPRASINSMTYFYRHVLRKEPVYIGLHANFYARRKIEHHFINPGGDRSLEDWQNFKKLIDEKEHEEAMASAAEMLKKYPEQFPIAYLAAGEAAQADMPERAIELLKLAISLGWTDGTYLSSDQRFESLRDNSDFQALLLTLDDNISGFSPAFGFDARAGWTPNGVRVKDPNLGISYLLSTVLAVTRDAGTTVDEAIAYLDRSAKADFTHPRGDFFFSLTGDVRTTTREPGFLNAIDELLSMGFRARVTTRVLPQFKHEILGLQIGSPEFKWDKTRQSLLPGAIAENLTSYGGVMTEIGGQTKLSEFLRAGAAGSCGTVFEPFSVQEKFPTPYLYVDYARGASLAEAFYLNITGPYQLLIVGDPLCRPFSNAPQPKLNEGLRLAEENAKINFQLEGSGQTYAQYLSDPQQAAYKTQPLAAVALRILLDGREPKWAAMQNGFDLNLGNMVGYHEMRLKLYADDPLSQSAETVLPVWVGKPEGIRLERIADGKPESIPGWSVSSQQESIKVKVQASAGKRVSIWHDWEQLASASGATAEFSVPLDQTGRGPVRLQAKAELEDGRIVQSLPVILNVTP